MPDLCSVKLQWFDRSFVQSEQCEYFKRMRYENAIGPTSFNTFQSKESFKKEKC